MTDDGLFTRDEVLGGLPARRARTALFLLESRTAREVAQSRQAMALQVSPRQTRERDLDFLEAFTLGREPPLHPSIHDLNRYAADWADLVPDNVRVRATLAHLLAEKYTFSRHAVPWIREAIGLDSAPVQRAFQQLYGQPLESIYATSETIPQRVRHLSARLTNRLESLPPFWTAFSLSLTETVGAGVLAIPIASAQVGTAPAMVLLVIIGMTTMLTLTSLAESFSRSGPAHYGEIFFGRLVTDYLGRPAAWFLNISLAFLTILVLIAFYVGVSTTFTQVTGLPTSLGVILVSGAGILLVTRRTLNATVSSALVVGTSSIVLVLLMAGLTIPHIRQEDLTYAHIPFVHGVGLEPSLFSLVFGILLSAYFGHLSVGNCASVVLRRDPSGKSLIRGCMAAQLAAMILYLIWTFAINGSINHTALGTTTGTALVPLARVAGPVVLALGSIFVILAMGMGSVHMTLSLRNLTRELLPGEQTWLMPLTRSHGRIVLPLGKGNETLLSVSYLGERAGRARFRIETQANGKLDFMVTETAGRCVLRDLGDRLPLLREAPASLGFDVVDADEDSVRLRVSAPEPPRYEGDWILAGPQIEDLLTMPDADRAMLQWIMRQGSPTLEAITSWSEQASAITAASVARLVEQGSLREVRNDGQVRFRAHLARTRRSTLPAQIWEALGQEADQPAGPLPRLHWWQQIRQLMGQPRYRNWLSLVPIALVFAITEVLLARGIASFSAPIEVTGIVSVSVLAGVFPMLLLLGARRKGERVPGIVIGFLGAPILIVLISLVFLGNLLIHAFIIWEPIPEKIAALAAAIAVVVIAIAATRRGLLVRRVVLELRQQGAGQTWTVTSGGKAVPVDLTFEPTVGEPIEVQVDGITPIPSTMRSASTAISLGNRGELEIWAYHVTDTGEAEPLPAIASLGTGPDQRQYDLRMLGGRLVLPLQGRQSVRVDMVTEAGATQESERLKT